MECTYSSAPDLCEDHDTRRYLEVLTHLQVAREIHSGHYDIIAPHRELHGQKEAVSVIGKYQRNDNEHRGWQWDCQVE